MSSQRPMLQIIQCLAAAVPLLEAWQGGEGATSRPARVFVDVTDNAGISTVNVCGPAIFEKKYILEVNGPGVGLFDADADGDLDVWFTNGSTLEALRDGKPGAGNTLWANQGGMKFSNITDAAHIGGSRWGNGVAMADVDNDGDVDVFVAEFGPDCLYINDGAAHFKEVGAEAGLTDPRWSSGCTFVDYDRDGRPDLFVANYIRFNLQSPPPYGGDSRWRGKQVMRGPRGLEKDTSLLYRNTGVADGVVRFADVTAASGIAAAKPSYPLGVVAVDYDRDGDDDIYVANDSEPNEMFENLGNGTFKLSGDRLGVAVDEYGKVGSGMGVCAAEFTPHGDLGIVVTNFSGQPNNLYKYDGGGFTDIAWPAGIAGPSTPRLGWGCQWIDADNDGARDLFVTNGHVYPEADSGGTDTSYAQGNQLFKNKGDGKFVDVSHVSGLSVQRVHRGAAFGDLDRDGDLDVIVSVLNGRPVVLRNDMAGGNHFITFELEGTKSGRSAVGAVVTIRYGNTTARATCQPGSSFQCSNDPRVHFGLGTATAVDAVEVRWPSGTVQTIKTPAVDRFHKIKETVEQTTTTQPAK